MSQLKVNSVVDASGGNTATINSMTPTADSLQGFRNRVINGDMRIDQRNAGASVTVSNATVTYITDRWNVFEDTSGAISSQQSTTAPSGFTNSLLVSVTSAGTSTAAQLCRVQQRIEGFNVADLGFGTASAKSITISFWVRSSLTGTYCVNVRNNATDRSYVATYTINSANTFEYKTITIAGDTTGTWLTNNGVGMFISWDLGSGSNANTTAGSWTAANKENTSAQANWIGTASATFYITGVQLEVGSTATPFERRPYGTELMLCQRYCLGCNSIQILGQAFGASTAAYYYNLPATMRTTPVLSTTSGFTTSTAGGGSASITPSVTSQTGQNVLRLDGASGSSLTAGNATILVFPATVSLSAEL